jgi:hypothetical protein
MQTWAKRGIQTALVTGGLLMLGTGIASADEDVNPDRPAPPLDGSLVVPLNIDNNALGTPLGSQVDVPKVKTELINVRASEATGNAAQVASDAVAPFTGGDPLLGNKVAADVVVPFDVSGNAIGALGDAAAVNESRQTVDQTRPIFTNGTGDTLAANVIDLDYAAPVQLTGNAVAGLGNAKTDNTSIQETWTTGDIGTDGSEGFLSGNLVAGHGTTPVQATGNAISAGGVAAADSEATNDSAAGGALYTEGTNGLGAGNAGGVPVAVPFELNNNAVGGAANTFTTGSADVKSQAGSQHGQESRDAAAGEYIVSNGEGGTVAGTVLQPGAAGPASVECNALAGLATSEASCESTSDVTAGGGNQTTGTDGLASGTIGDAPAASPVEVFSNAGAVGGDAIATDTNTVDSAAGGDNHTLADNGTGSGTVVAPSASGPVDVFSNAAGGAGNALASTDNTSTTSSGGFTGTSGDNSFAGGNAAPVPVALPTEGFGNTAAGAGTATTTGTTEVKKSTSGGDTSTDDDGGFGASNVVGGGMAGPVQLIGNGAGAAGDAVAGADATNTVTAGGNTTATGTGGAIAGNIGQALVSLPAQGFANHISGAGTGQATGDVDTTSSAGGNTESDGKFGFVSGNVASVPAGSAGQAFGDSAAALGVSDAEAQNTTDSNAGGFIDTSGENGFAAGNVASGQAMPIVQGFGAGVAGVGGLNSAAGDNATAVSSGGDIDTNGDRGTISGNLVDVPAGVIGQGGGDAVSAVGADATGAAESNTTGTAGGTSTTTGMNGFLSGLDGTLPAGANLSMFGVPVEVIAEAVAGATNTQNFTVGEAEPMVDMALDGDTTGGLPATEVPRLPMLAEFASLTEQPRTDVPSVPGLGPVTGLLGGLTGALGGGGLGGGALPTGLPAGGPTGAVSGLTGGLPSLDMLNAVTGGLGKGGLPVAPEAGLPGVSHLRHRLPQLPALPGTAHTMAVPKVGAPVPALPGLGPVTGLLGSLFGGGGLPLVGGLGGGLPAVGGLGGGLVPQVPAVPAAADRPSVPGVPASVPGLSNLTKAPAVSVPTLGKLPVQPALTGLDTSTVLDPAHLTDNASLADTRSKLSKLLGEHHID